MIMMGEKLENELSALALYMDNKNIIAGVCHSFGVKRYQLVCGSHSE